MLPAVHPRHRPIVSWLLLALSIVPSLPTILSYSQKTESIKSAQFQQGLEADRQTAEAAALEAKALGRARTCMLADDRYPMVEGGPAFYNVGGRPSDRFLPDKTTLCSASSGVTAIVAQGVISDPAPGSPEKIRAVLRSRGLIK